MIDPELETSRKLVEPPPCVFIERALEGLSEELGLVARNDVDAGRETRVDREFLQQPERGRVNGPEVCERKAHRLVVGFVLDELVADAGLELGVRPLREGHRHQSGEVDSIVAGARADCSNDLLRETMSLPAARAGADDRDSSAAHATASHFFPQRAP